MNEAQIDKLTLAAEKGFNVLFSGKHGVGKTAVVEMIFNKVFGSKDEGNWVYFSAATMDPWVDLIGVPREQQNEKGESYLGLVRPEQFAGDDNKVQAIFLDEYNRAHKKVQNACMELLQFKSINGRKFPNLKVVWAAINPKEEEDTTDGMFNYHVEEMDSAQKDRFHIQMDIPFDVDRRYFVEKYGESEGTAACDFWSELPDAIRFKISPRRLDYWMAIATSGIDPLKDVLPPESNPNRLLKMIRNGSPAQHFRKLAATRDVSGLNKFAKDSDNWQVVEKVISDDRELLMCVLPALKPEMQIKLGTDNNHYFRLMLDNVNMFQNALQHFKDNHSTVRVQNHCNVAIASFAKETDDFKTKVAEIPNNLFASPATTLDSKIKFAKENFSIDIDKVKDRFDNLSEKPLPSYTLPEEDVDRELINIANTLSFASATEVKQSCVSKLSLLINKNMTEGQIQASLAILESFLGRQQASKMYDSISYTHDLIQNLLALTFTKDASKLFVEQFVGACPNIVAKYLLGIKNGDHFGSANEQVLESAIKVWSF